MTYAIMTHGTASAIQTRLLVAVVNGDGEAIAGTETFIDNRQIEPEPPFDGAECNGLAPVSPDPGYQRVNVTCFWEGETASTELGADLAFDSMFDVLSWSIAPYPFAEQDGSVAVTVQLDGEPSEWAELALVAVTGLPGEGDSVTSLHLDETTGLFGGDLRLPAEPGLADVYLVVTNNRGGLTYDSTLVGLIPSDGRFDSLTDSEASLVLAGLDRFAPDRAIRSAEGQLNADPWSDLAIDSDGDGEPNVVHFRDAGGDVIETLRIVRDSRFSLISSTSLLDGHRQVLRDVDLNGTYDEVWVDGNDNLQPETGEIVPLDPAIEYSLPSVFFPPGSVGPYIPLPPDNSAPAFDEAAFAFTVSERAEPGTLIGTLTASDSEDDPLTFWGAPEEFALSHTTGELRLSDTASLDHTHKPLLGFLAWVSDDQGGESSVSVSITVTE